MHRLLLVALVLVAACSRSSTTATLADLPEIDPSGFRQILSDLDRPAVVNVWASWCLPCRAEAPLLTEAYTKYRDRIAFIGINYNDNQPGARQFLEEFQLPFPHYFDPSGAVVADLGGFGVPRTYFFAPGGELLKTHNGVIDEQTLALQIDELLRR